MSISLISQYYNKVEKLIHFDGMKKETSERNEFMSKGIDMFKWVCMVSVEAVKIVKEKESMK